MEVTFNDLLSSTCFYFKSKVIELSHKGENVSFFNFGALFKMCFFEVVTFFLVVIQSTQFFSGGIYS